MRHDQRAGWQSACPCARLGADDAATRQSAGVAVAVEQRTPPAIAAAQRVVRAGAHPRRV
eukprot:13132843-Alexandrium_andersonii.AAC.1